MSKLPYEQLFIAEGYVVKVVASSHDLLDAVDRTLFDLRSPSSDEGTDVFVIDGAAPTITMQRTGMDVERHFDSEYELLAALVTDINRAALDANPASLHLHAAAGSLGERTALVVARSGGGKTSTIAALVMRGWTYLTDEMVSLGPNSERIGAFPKPLTVKRSGFAQFSELAGIEVGPSSTSTATRWQVPGSMIGSISNDGGCPAIIVLLDDDPNASDIVAYPSASETVVALAEQCMDLDRYGSEGLKLLADLSARCMRVRLTRSHPAEMATTIEKLVEESEPLRLRTEIVSQPEGWLFQPVMTVRVGDEAVVRNQMNGRLASLNVEGTSVWVAFVESGAKLPDSSVDREFIRSIQESRVLVPLALEEDE